MIKNKECNSYGWQKLYQAVSLLTGHLDRKERLNLAITKLTSIRPEQHLPISMREDFSLFMKKIINIDINKLNDNELSFNIQKILYFYDTATRYQEPFEE